MADRIFRAFCSLKLTLANLFAIFLAMVAGTFVNPGYAPPAVRDGAADRARSVDPDHLRRLLLPLRRVRHRVLHRAQAHLGPRHPGRRGALGGAAHCNADAFRLELEEICAGIGLEAPKQGAARAA
jgi:hypothetical protein